jgi:hypothetical protein
VEHIQRFFKNNPRLFGLVLILLGIGLIVYTVFNREDLLSGSTNRNRIKDFSALFGERVGRVISFLLYLVLSLSLVVSGLVLILLGK